MICLNFFYCGKVCLQAASNVATKYNAKVFYLDTGNSFSPQRISGLVNWKPGAALDRVTKIRVPVGLFLPLISETIDLFESKLWSN